MIQTAAAVLAQVQGLLLVGFVVFLRVGAAAAVLCYAVVQVFGLIRRLSQGADINVLTYPIQAMLAATFGVAGAVFADWYRRKGLRVSSDISSD